MYSFNVGINFAVGAAGLLVLLIVMMSILLVITRVLLKKCKGTCLNYLDKTMTGFAQYNIVHA